MGVIYTKRGRGNWGERGKVVIDFIIGFCSWEKAFNIAGLVYSVCLVFTFFGVLCLALRLTCMLYLQYYMKSLKRGRGLVGIGQLGKNASQVLSLIHI